MRLRDLAGKPVHVAFDGGRLTSDAGILLPAAIEQRLKIADRLAAWIEDPRLIQTKPWPSGPECILQILGRHSVANPGEGTLFLHFTGAFHEGGKREPR